MSETADLELVHLSKRYGTTTAVDAIDLRVPGGSYCCLLGPSGCGKTSTLRMIAGHERASDGDILLGGRNITHLSAAERGTAMMFQSYALFPHLNALDNVAFSLRMRGMPKAQRHARAMELLALVAMEAYAQRKPAELSGGQQQRVALARALAPQPRLLLLDEPFSNLDVDLRERLAHELRNILKQTSTTALFVTHDQMEAFAVGDLIGVMNHGRLEQWDDAYHLYHRPATRFVADFIGHGVFAPARIVESVHGPVVRTPLGDLTDLEECPLPTAYPDGECEVLLRADDIVHDDASPVKARIERKAFRGSEFLYTLRLESGEQVLAHVPSHHDHALGEWIGIRPDVDHVVTFPKETAG